MTHDLEDLLDLIKKLEERIILLEKKENVVRTDDSWYWDH